ncbi:MAG: hypothetical protein II916_03220, partial [Oscillospiraceae bacterium]|nr:hypothetical protein [Oscillospiraceae bacterium]
TTDGSEWKDKDEQYHITGQQVLNCTADLGALTHVAAGETRTEQVTMQLDPAQTAQIGEIFTNGFFVEGYLLLEGAENCCDVSIPLFGFHGDWAKVPIFEADSVQTTSLIGDFGYTYTPSFAKAVRTMAEIQQLMPEDARSDPFAEQDSLYAEYATEEQLALLDEAPDTYYISPNSDGILDTIGFTLDTLRYGCWEGLDIYDKDGNLVSEGEREPVPMRYGSLTGENRNDLNDLADGEYRGVARAMVDYADSIADPQTIEISFVVDKTAPAISGTVSEKNGRKILTVTAQDSALDGIYILGTGRGGQAGSFDPEAEETTFPDYLGAASEAASYYVSFPSFTDRAVDYDQLPVFGKSLTGALNPAESADVDFTDMIVAEPDEDGVFTFEYDITDMSSYSFTAVDKAFNMSVYAQEAKLAEELPSGIYKGHAGVYSFDGKNMVYRAYQDAARTETAYTMKDGVLETDGRKIRVEQVSSLSYRLVNEDGTSEMIFFEREGTADDYHFYSTDQIVGRVKAFMEASFPMFEISRTETSLDSTGTVLVRIYVDDERKGEILMATAKIDHTTGIGISPQIGLVELFPVIPTDLNGVWMAFDQDGKTEYWEMNTPNSVTALSQADKSERTFTYDVQNDQVVFHFDGKDVPADYFIYDEGDALFAFEDDTTLTLAKVNDTNLGLFRFFSDEELCEMALDYYETQTGKRPEKAEVLSSIEGMVTIQVGDATYVVDQYSASGTDGNGEEVDLLSTLPLMEDPFRAGIWMATGNSARYFSFNGNGGGSFQSLEDGDGLDFTYEMTPVGMTLTFADDEAETSLGADLFVQEDGSVVAVWGDDAPDTFVFVQEGDFDSFSYYTTAELEEMAIMHIPEEAPYATSEVNPDGTVVITMQDETGEVKEIYTVDPVTAEGVNMDGEPEDIKTAFETDYPENAAYDRETLEEWAKEDLLQKTGRRAAAVESFVNRDGSLYITMTDENGDVIDFYTIDPATGEGTNQNGDAVNLPQTGNNAPQTAAVASGSVMLTLAGLFTAWRSGILRRKKRGE